MKKMHTNRDTHPVIHAVKSLILKLKQHPEIYPIKYFKKGKFEKNRKHQLLI